MPNQPKKPKRRSPWAYLSIKYKLSFSIALVVSIVGFFLYTLSLQANNVMNQAYAQSSEYYNINRLQQNLIASDELLETYISNVSSRSLYIEEWDTLRATITAELAALNTDLNSVSLDQYFLATALQTGFTAYRDACDDFLIAGVTGADTATLYAQYQSICDISTHLQSTALLLQTETLTTGHTNLASLRQTLDETTQSLVFASVLLVFLIIFFISELIQTIVVPILRLAEASTAVRDGNFENPDVEVSNRDEIYTLTVSFNEMKRNMQALFHAMQRQTEMEQALHQKELEAQKNSALLAEAQMQQLRNQVNPHFLFNTLNIISRTARSEGARKTEKLILALARLFRYGLKTEADEVPLAREMNIVNDYIAIQSTRFAGRVSLYWRIAPGLDPERALVPSFLLQPLIENAVIHGLEPKLEGGSIRIRVQQQGTALHIILTDNGIGMTEETRQALLSQQSTKGHVSGIGVGNVRSRLQLLCPGATFALKSRPNLGTSIQMVIPSVFTPQQEEGAADE